MKSGLAKIIEEVKLSISRNELNKELARKAIISLTEIGHSAYDSNKFPKLENTSSLLTDIGTTPKTLAEALLWKMGKWPTYLNFSKSYNNKDLKVSAEGGVVFSAFAKHLQDNKFPIYDQHAIRAIWAVCDLAADEAEKCKKLLFDKSGRWKQSGSGDDGSCYEIFLKKVTNICEENRISHQDLDMLLMPLGQAIKKETRGKKNNNKNEFEIFKKLINQ